MTWCGSGNPPPGRVFMKDEKWELLAQLAEDSDYWSKAQDFMKQVHGRELSSMSNKQVDWYYNIDASLDRELSLKEAKEGWGEDSEQAKRVFEELYGRGALGRRRVG